MSIEPRTKRERRARDVLLGPGLFWLILFFSGPAGDHPDLQLLGQGKIRWHSPGRFSLITMSVSRIHFISAFSGVRS